MSVYLSRTRKSRRIRTKEEIFTGRKQSNHRTIRPVQSGKLPASKASQKSNSNFEQAKAQILIFARPDGNSPK